MYRCTYVPYVPTYLMYLRTLSTYVPYLPTYQFLCTYIRRYSAYVKSVGNAVENNQVIFSTTAPVYDFIVVTQRAEFSPMNVWPIEP